MDQSLFITNILTRFNMLDSKPVDTPMDPSSHLSEEDECKTSEERSFMANIPYREATGSLIYTMVATRFDISYSVGVISRFLSNPGPKHWNLVKRIL